MQKDPSDKLHHSQQAVLDRLLKQKLVEDLVHKQDMPRHDLVESLVHKENMAPLRQLINQLAAGEIAQILEQLSLEDQWLIWEQLDNDHKQAVQQEAPSSVLQLLAKPSFRSERPRIKALLFRVDSENLEPSGFFQT
jgi:hypothetical protein